ncbi:hypothetical protein [Burkholderia multivorans]|uniref:hypothetical protein n=1 Tax=Burkholderia multivorans TaxID=87883 RepID=UPI001C218634|nr:hypothetical protein [Burkholderia multivorans]WVN04325.1 hypothetical protein V1241_17260 [Burkholderia multivorans]
MQMTSSRRFRPDSIDRDQNPERDTGAALGTNGVANSSVRGRPGTRLMRVKGGADHVQNRKYPL